MANIKFHNVIDHIYNFQLMNFNLNQIEQHKDFIIKKMTFQEILDSYLYLESEGYKYLEENKFDVNNYSSPSIGQDPFLINYRNNNKLFNEIIKYGTYWPIIFAEIENTNKIIIFEGVHRLNAIYYGYRNNKWPTNKLLYCIIGKNDLLNARLEIKKPIYEIEKYFHYSEEYNGKYKLSTPLTLRFVNNIGNHYFELIQNRTMNIMYHNYVIYEIDINNFVEFYLIYDSLLGKYNQNIFYFYKTNKMIYPNKRINLL
ncbi:MAG: hypothetical protein ACOCP8_01700 [archaeon]